MARRYVRGRPRGRSCGVWQSSSAPARASSSFSGFCRGSAVARPARIPAELGGSTRSTGTGGTHAGGGTTGAAGAHQGGGTAGTTGSPETTGAAGSTGAAGASATAGTTGAAGAPERPARRRHGNDRRSRRRRAARDGQRRNDRRSRRGGQPGTSSAGTTGTAGTTPGASPAGAGGSIGTSTGNKINNVFVIAMENEPAAAIYGNKNAPYLNGLLSKYARARRSPIRSPTASPASPTTSGWRRGRTSSAT